MEKTYPYSSLTAADDDLEAGSGGHYPILLRPRSAMAGPTGFFCDFDEEDDGGPHRHFLDRCFLCKKPLGVGYGEDIFMYRGNTPFCSEECRQVQIEMDEVTEVKKSKMKNGKDVNRNSSSRKIQVRTNAGTVVAV